MRLAGFILLTASAASLLPAAEPKERPSDARIQEIITAFAAKEAEFAQVRQGYTYRQTARVLDVDEGGGTIGKWEMVTDIIFTSDGRRTEKVVRAPISTLKNFFLDPGDEEDLRRTQPFVLTTNELPNYRVDYLGRENIDELGCFVFAVKPKKMEAGKRYFVGQIWVDDRDLQIVKSFGRGAGVRKKNSDNQYPKFETYREQIDGKYWFPTYTTANDVLQFDSGQVARIKMTVRYEDYKQFKSDVRIIYEDTEAKPSEPAKPPVKK
jgi:hypothetical protein